MGVPRLTNRVWAAHLRAAEAVIQSEDPLIQFYCQGNDFLGRVERAAEGLGIPWTEAGLRISQFKEALHRTELDEWGALGVTGHGVACFRDDPIGNRWLSSRKLLRESGYIRALRLRANVVGTREALRRVNPEGPAECRHCGHRNESLKHVLNVCLHNHAKIIKRHDDIKDLIVEKLRVKGWTVAVETPVRVGAGTFRPDIIAVRNGDVRVVDVAVAYEDDNALSIVADGKISKYECLEEVLLGMFQGSNFAVIPIVIGSRGAVVPRTTAAIKQMGLSPTVDGLTMSMVALRCSIAIAARHISAG